MPSSNAGDAEKEQNTPTRHSKRTTSSADNATPIRKSSSSPAAKQLRTPNSAPPGRKNTTGAARKAEPPTLFQEFLLGRPSPQRTRTTGKKGENGKGDGVGNGAAKAARRKSLDVVKREIRLGQQEVGKIQKPGGVKERVQQWQKASAGAVVVDPAEAAKGRERGDGVGDDEKNDRGDEGQEKGRIRNVQKRPGRRKSKEAEDVVDDDPGGERNASKVAARVAVGRERSKSAAAAAAAPKKRVISDDHWMMKTTTSTKKISPPGKGGRIPRDFLEKTALNPPVERKIDDWIKRTGPAGDDAHEMTGSREASKHEVTRSTPRRRKVSRQENDDVDVDGGTPTKRRVSRQTAQDDTDPEDTPRRRKPSGKKPADDEIKVRDSIDNGIRIRPSPESAGDDTEGFKSRDTSFNAGDDTTPLKPVGKQRRPKMEDPAEFRTPRNRSEKHLRPPDRESLHDMNSRHEDEEHSSWATPSRTESKRRQRRSGSPSDSVSEIPFGNSAFSVLELPVGAEAGTMRRPLPKRNPSFAVPKVLKKVYNEGMKIVHDTVDPPRVGVNQPPSIESWLKGTADPFVDRPATASDLSVPEPPSRTPSYKEGDRTERGLMEDADRDRSTGRKRAQSYHEGSDVEPKSLDRDDSPATRARETLPSMGSSPPLSTSGLRRSPATRITSSPKSARKSPFKEALLDAFRGESTTYRPKGNPLADISSHRDNRRLPEFKFEDLDDAKASGEPPPKPGPHVQRQASADQLSTKKEKPLPEFPRSQAPTTGEHRLSTIASVETFTTNSSATETASELSRTTVTQSTIFTAPTASTLSRNSNKSVLKRRLTKHSDLVSMLSLPDSGAPSRAKSIRSARSVRTNRSHLGTATIQDLMRELADDESKYIRELKTLVDGVIPVLLTCVLSKSDSAIAAGLFDTDSSEGLDPSFTKPIVDMGVALERLRSLHNRIPLEDPKAFVTWLQGAHKSYDDYLTAWRMGFQDVVVNLAPASRSSSASQSPTLDEIPRNANGDVVGSNGARVDVAFLLKRPLVRIKYLEKILKGIMKHELTEQYEHVNAAWEELRNRVGRRVNEEKARLEDRIANNTDTTRARDLETLAAAEDVKIDRTRQVYFKDDFSLDLSHSTGQRIECQVELIIRDKPSDKNDAGDVLIVASDADSIKKWLLFPPIDKQYISCRIGDHPGETVVMIRGSGQKWHECFLLRSEDHEATTELIDIFGSVPLPPKIIQDDASVVSKLTESHIGIKGTRSETNVSNKKDSLEVPIGSRSRSIIDKERARRQAEEESSTRIGKQHPSSRGKAPSTISEKSVVSGASPKDLNEVMRKAGIPGFTATKHARARYHSRGENSLPAAPHSRTDGSAERQPSLSPDYDCIFEDPHKNTISKHDYYMSGGLDDVTTLERQNSPSSAPASPKLNGTLEESMRPEANVLKKQRSPTPQDDEPPPPPAHQIPTTPSKLKKAAPILDSPKTKAKSRRTSSPLKHEYQPSVASETSYSSEASDSDDASYSESSDDELEAAELPEPPPTLQYSKRLSPPVSLYNLPNGSVAPSSSASQTPCGNVPSMPLTTNAPRLVAFISAWDDKHGRWLDLHSGPCSIVVSPGKIEAFEMSAAHSSPHRDLSSPDLDGADEVRPLIEQGLTPHVNLRRGVAVDLNITSRPTSNSLLQVTGTNIIRYRTNTVPDNIQLYNLVHKARLENPVFKQLELDRRLSGFGQKNVYEDAVAASRRRSFFGRKNSYRASVRAPSTSASASDAQSLTSSTITRLRRMSGSMFNIGKSSVDTDQAGRPTSQYGSSSNSTFSGLTPPHTPTSPSLAGTNASSSGNTNKYTTENLKIRLYYLATRSSWDDRGAARITITAPPPGMRQRSSINQGLTRRIIVTQEIKEKDGKKEITILDEVLGADCFGRIGRTGVLCQIWDEVRGDNGEVGTVGKEGGVSGRTRKWCFQTKGEGDADWIFSLCSVRMFPGGVVAGAGGVGGGMPASFSPVIR